MLNSCHVLESLWHQVSQGGRLGAGIICGETWFLPSCSSWWKTTYVCMYQVQLGLGELGKFWWKRKTTFCKRKLTYPMSHRHYKVWYSQRKGSSPNDGHMEFNKYIGERTLELIVRSSLFRDEVFFNP